MFCVRFSETVIKSAEHTRVQRVADVSVAAHVLVQCFDPDDLRSCGGQVRDCSFVAGAQERWRVIVAVLYLNDNLYKVSLYWNFLITHLRRIRILLKYTQEAEVKHNEADNCHIFLHFILLIQKLTKCVTPFFQNSDKVQKINLTNLPNQVK